MRQFLGPSGLKGKSIRSRSIKPPKQEAAQPQQPQLPQAPTVYYDSEGRPVFSTPPGGQPNVNNPYTIYGNPLPYTPVGGNTGGNTGGGYNPGVQPGQVATPGKTIFGADSVEAPTPEETFSEEFGNRASERRDDLADRGVSGGGSNPFIYTPTAGPGTLNTDNQDEDELDYIFG